VDIDLRLESGRGWLVFVLQLVLTMAAAALALAGPAATTRDAAVVYVDDGDTIDVRLDDRVERVRYIGIDAPEIAHDGLEAARGGEEAARLNRTLVAGRRVRLEIDREERDRYGRLLAYVWVGDTMANLEMVRRGYARALTIPPNVRYAASFAAAEAEAHAAGRGLWSEDPKGARERSLSEKSR
jgi:micrococcal nuclease